MADSETIHYYQTHACDLAQRYQAGGPDVENLFRPGDLVLDVGCGSGRDLCRLLERGINALGCDLSTAMLDQASLTLTSSDYKSEDRLQLAGLPDLSPYPENAFDGILCTAVLMHLPKEHHFDAMWRMHRLLKPGGRLQLSFPLSRPHIDPDSSRDADGRLFLSIDPNELTLLCERIGYQLLKRQDSQDPLGRKDITWCSLCFRRLDEKHPPPLQQVEQILNRDKKSATYKLALFRALAELAQTRPHLGHFTGEGHVRIPPFFAGPS